MKKQMIRVLIGGMLCLTTLTSQAVMPPVVVVASGDPVVAAINRATQAVQQIPQQTADKLNPSLLALLSGIQDVQKNQTQVWNQFVGMQADERFTGIDNKSDAYQAINRSYDGARNLVQADPLVRENPEAYQAWRLLRQPHNNPQSCEGASGVGCDTRIDANGYDYQDELALITQARYNNPAQVQKLVLAMVNDIQVNKNDPLMLAVPYTVIMGLVASRTDGANGAPSLMAALKSTIGGYFMRDHEATLAAASALDVARAQVQATELNSYLLYQNMQLQQQQLAMMAAMMAQNGVRR